MLDPSNLFFLLFSQFHWGFPFSKAPLLQIEIISLKSLLLKLHNFSCSTLGHILCRRSLISSFGSWRIRFSIIWLSLDTHVINLDDYCNYYTESYYSNINNLKLYGLPIWYKLRRNRFLFKLIYVLIYNLQWLLVIILVVVARVTFASHCSSSL